MNKENKKETERIKRANAMLFQDKACPICGARLAVCKKPYNEGSFPSLNIVDANMESQYYCPICEKYFENTAELKQWHGEENKKFADDGKKYYFKKEFTSRRIVKTFWILLISALLVAPVFIKYFVGGIRDFSLGRWALSVIFGVAIFVLSYFAIYYYKMIRVCKRAFIEPASNGVIFCNGANVVYIPWQNFRICSVVSRENAPDAFAFDSVETSFIVNENMEDYRALALEIGDKIKDIAKLDPKMLHLIYA